MVVCYSGDRDAPPTEDGRHYFGLDEWREFDAALEFAVAHGARKVLLSTWSMGATIALKLLAGSRHRAIVMGWIITAPVIDWEQTLLEHGRRAGLPHFLPRTGILLMGSRWLTTGFPGSRNLWI
ncbi:hypothetical protein [Arthrobacter sp. efr-133-TYG-118]|uniref:hypothetical protein n=1 Tax=Arthrobacter sp. efr-133-TYG-118 TaxID=3040279 RepID=UPI002550FEBE|nr:hypothetical protein [Arthrobacter sp. efr-133-TYG-118]